jgi:iron-sulfur cluster repair protein YtfE (RIC family)
VEWIRDFKGDWHLTREENILFPALMSAGTKQHCTIGDALDEHKREREQFMYMAPAAANLRAAHSGI